MGRKSSGSKDPPGGGGYPPGGWPVVPAPQCLEEAQSLAAFITVLQGLLNIYFTEESFRASRARPTHVEANGGTMIWHYPKHSVSLGSCPALTGAPSTPLSALRPPRLPLVKSGSSGSCKAADTEAAAERRGLLTCATLGTEVLTAEGGKVPQSPAV